MEPVEVKTIGELIDELIIANIKIWHLVDGAGDGDGDAAIGAQKINQKRTSLIRAINRRLEPDRPNVDEKVYTNG